MFLLSFQDANERERDRGQKKKVRISRGGSQLPRMEGWREGGRGAPLNDETSMVSINPRPYFRINVGPPGSIILLSTVVTGAGVEWLLSLQPTSGCHRRQPIGRPLGQGGQLWRGLATAAAQVISPTGHVVGQSVI